MYNPDNTNPKLVIDYQQPGPKYKDGKMVDPNKKFNVTDEEHEFKTFDKIAQNIMFKDPVLSTPQQKQFMEWVDKYKTLIRQSNYKGIELMLKDLQARAAIEDPTYLKGSDFDRFTYRVSSFVATPAEKLLQLFGIFPKHYTIEHFSDDLLGQKYTNRAIRPLAAAESKFVEQIKNVYDQFNTDAQKVYQDTKANETANRITNAFK